MSQGDDGQTQELSTLYRALILIASLVAVFVLHRELNLLQYFTGDRIGSTIEAVRAWVDRFGVWGPAVFVGVCSLAMAANAPSVLIITLSVMLFGRLIGGLLSFLIVCAGLTLIFAIARWLGRPLVKRVFRRGLQKMENTLTRRELTNVILIRLIMYLNPATNWLLSVSGMRYRSLLLGTLVGAGPGILVNIWLASVFVELFRATESPNPLEQPQLLIPVALGILLFVVVRVVDRRRRRQDRSTDTDGMDEPSD